MPNRPPARDFSHISREHCSGIAIRMCIYFRSSILGDYPSPRVLEKEEFLHNTVSGRRQYARVQVHQAGTVGADTKFSGARDPVSHQNRKQCRDYDPGLNAERDEGKRIHESSLEQTRYQTGDKQRAERFRLSYSHMFQI